MRQRNKISRCEGQSANERRWPVQLVGVRGTCGSMQASMPAQSGAIMLDASCRCASSKHLCGEQAQALALLAPCQWQSGKAAAPQRAGQCGRKGRVFVQDRIIFKTHSSAKVSVVRPARVLCRQRAALS